MEELKQKQIAEQRKAEELRRKQEEQGQNADPDALKISMGGKPVTITGLTESDQANVSVEQQEGGEEFVQLWREPQAKSASTLDASEIYSDDARRSQHEVELARKLSAFNDVNNKRMHDAAEKLEKTHAFQQQKE